MKFYVTFGQVHKHPVTKELMKDYWVEVYTEEYCRAHWKHSSHRMDSLLHHVGYQRVVVYDIMHDKYKEQWGDIYLPEEFDPTIFPKGCYETIGIPSDEEIFEDRLRDIYEQRRNNRKTEGIGNTD